MITIALIILCVILLIIIVRLNKRIKSIRAIINSKNNWPVFCKNCAYHVNKRGDSILWYDQICIIAKDSQTKYSKDYVYGVDENSPVYCRDINTDGKCKLYEPYIP